MEDVFSRRRFVAGAMALGGSLALGGSMVLAGCSPQRGAKAGRVDSSEPHADTEADVIVVGSGLAGVSCAAAAAQRGAKVMLIDKAPFLMSSFLTSKGNVSIAQVPENKAYWRFEPEAPATSDTMDAFIDRYRALTEIGRVEVPYPDYDRTRHLMQESCATVAWVEQMGIGFEKSFTKEQVGTDTVKPAMTPDSSTEAGVRLADAFAAELDRLDVQVRLSTEAVDLISEGGAVAGVRTADPEGQQELRAKAVVLATGGFGGSQEHCDRLVPVINQMGFQYLGNAMNTGDGMTLASALGAALYDDCWVIPNVIMPSRALTEVDAAFGKLRDFGMKGASTSDKLLVNAAGMRFVNEADPVTSLATALADGNSGPYYVLFDSSNADVVTIIEKGLATGDVMKGESIAELAEVSRAFALPSTFETYQQAAIAGVDESFGKAADKLAPYADGPFYLVPYVPSYVATMGGVKTDASCRVIAESGDVIPHLYAIGELTHRFLYNRSFVRHCSNSTALTMGRLTGEALAAHEPA
ncbi:FAD-dependent oxidoreductase [Eggerthellaceae bacterium zg-1084]|nr:FAD-dependent oxidoreductase [Berryella wangjianweii]